MKAKEQKPLTVLQVKAKMEFWCAFHDRSHFETRLKLKSFFLKDSEIEFIIAELISANFLNEERFACSYARGKFRIKKWGKHKIISGLREHRVSDFCIKKALKEIDAEDYIKVLASILITKNISLKEKNIHLKKIKLIRFALSRGFEQDLIQDCLKDIVN
jgi:regulatory protein